MFRDPRLNDSDRLAMLGSRDLLGRTYQSIHNRELGGAKAQEILAQLSQAEAYSAAASTAADSVKPLLQYYGVLANARALILLKAPSYREAALASSHGLSATGWKEHFGAGGDWLDARIRVDSGTFSQLAEVTANADIVQVPHRDGLWPKKTVTTSDRYPAGYEFCVRDVISRLTGAERLFEAITDSSAHCWWAHLWDNTDKLEVTVTSNRLGLPSDARIRELFSLGETATVTHKEELVSGLGPTDSAVVALPSVEEAGVTKHLINMSSGASIPYLVEPLPGEVRMSSAARLYAAAYALGMLVRYHPSVWSSYIGRASGDSAMPLIRETSLAVARFQGVMVDLL